MTKMLLQRPLRVVGLWLVALGIGLPLGAGVSALQLTFASVVLALLFLSIDAALLLLYLRTLPDTPARPIVEATKASFLWMPLFAVFDLVLEGLIRGSFAYLPSSIPFYGIALGSGPIAGLLGKRPSRQRL